MTAMKQVIAKLETELHEKSTNVSHLEAEIRSLQRKCQVKDQEIAKQEREIHKLKVSTSLIVIFFLKKNMIFEKRKFLNALGFFWKNYTRFTFVI